MTTASEMIYSAREYAGRALQGETLGGTLLASSLATLNSLIDGWRLDKLFAYRIREETFTWASGNQSRTVGSGGNFSTDRPVRVDPSTVFRKDDIDYPVSIYTAGEWANLSYKQATSEVPTVLYPEQGASLMTLYAYPIPSASLSIILKTWQILSTFSAGTDSVTLPPGYQDAIELSLGERLCMKAAKPIPPDLIRMAAMARAKIKSANITSPRAEVEVGYFKHGSPSIITG